MLRIKETHVNAFKVAYNRGYSDRLEIGSQVQDTSRSRLENRQDA